MAKKRRKEKGKEKRKERGKERFPFFPSPPPLSFSGSRLISRAIKTENPFHGLVLLRNQTETLATQASLRAASQIFNKTKHLFESLKYYLRILSSQYDSSIVFEEKTDDARACAQS